MSFHKQEFHKQTFHQPSFRIDKIEWKKRTPSHLSYTEKSRPTSYFDVLNQITEMDSQHIVGKGSLSSIEPLNSHWKEVMSFDSQDSHKGYISATSPATPNDPFGYSAIFDVNYIQQVKKAVGYVGSWQKFLREYSGTMYTTKSQDKQKFYLNDERKNSSALLIIYGKSFYVISPRVDF